MQFQAREFAAGRLPLWSPGSYSGFPFVADTQTAVFYPVRWLFLLFSLTSETFPYYLLQLEAISHIWLGGLFTYLLTHDILSVIHIPYPVSRKTPPSLTSNNWQSTIDHSPLGQIDIDSKRHNPDQESPPHLPRRSQTSHTEHGLRITDYGLPLLPTVAVALGGYLTSYPILQLAILETIIWLPLTLWLLRRAIVHAKRPFATLLLAGLTLGVAALAGHPQTLLHSGYLALAYFIFLTWRAGWPWRQRLFGLISWGLATVGVSAAGWLPTLVYLQNATRSDVSYEFVATGLPLLNYLQTFAPRALTQFAPEFVGVSTLLLVILAWQLRRFANGEVHFWAATAVFVAWLSLGDKGVLFEAAYYSLPGFSLFRQQERLVGLVSLALALLAAQGIALWLQHGLLSTLKRAGLWLAGLWLLAGLILTATWPLTNDGWQVGWLLSGGVALLTWLCLALIRNPSSVIRIPSRFTAYGLRFTLLLLLFLELWVGTRGQLGWVTGSPQAFWPQPDWVTAVLQEDGRFDSSLLILANGGEIYGYEDSRGISPLKLQAVAAYEDLPRPLRWQLLNVTHVLAWDALEPQLEPLMPAMPHIFPGEMLDQTLYRFTEPLPRARMVYDVVRVPDQAAALAALQQPTFDPRQQIILEAPQEIFYDDQQHDPEPVVNAKRVSPTRYEIDLKTAVPGYLTVSEWFYPGWQASTVNGIDYLIERANGGQQAIFIPGPVETTIILDYRPTHVWIGLAITAVSLLAILAQIFTPNRARKHTAKQTLQEPSLTINNWLLTIDNSPRPADGNARPSPPKNHFSLIIYHLSLIILSFTLRLFQLGHQELRGDEAFSFLFARRAFTDIIPALIREGDPHSPLHYLTLHGWMRLAGDSEFAMRYLGAMAAVLTVPLMMLLARRLFGRGSVVWLVGGLTAVSPLLIWLGQEVRNQYSFAILWTLAATLIITRMPSRHSDYGTRITAYGLRSMLPWLLYTLFATLAVYSHYYAIFALLAHPLLWLGNAQLGRASQWRLTRGWLLSGVATLLLFLPWGIAVLSGLLRAGQLSDPDTPELTRYLVRIGRELLVGSSLPGRWVRWLIIGCATALFSVLYSHFSKEKTINRRPNTKYRIPLPISLRFLLGWLALATVGIYLVRFSRATFNPFYIGVAAPAWLLLLAFVLSAWQAKPLRGWSFTIRNFLRFALLASLLFGTLVSLRNHYFDPAFSKTQGYRAVVEQVNTLREGDIVFVSNFPDPALDYYFRVANLVPQMQPARLDATAVSTANALKAFATVNDQLWFVPATGWDVDGVAADWLNSNLVLTNQSQHDSLTLLGYSPLPKANIQPQGSLFNGEIQLSDVHLLQNGRSLPSNSTLSLQPNDELAVTLIWQAETAVTNHYTVFVQLLDSDGFLIAQHDGVPQNGQRPTSTWQLDNIIIDRHVLTLPPDFATTNGQLIVGLYQTETVERLLNENGRDFAIITP